MRFYHLDALLSVYTWWLIFIDSLSPFYQFFSPIFHRDKHGWIIQSFLFSRIFLRKNRDQMLQFFRSLLFRNNDDDYFADTKYLERKRNSQFFFALIMQFINNAHKWKEFLSKYIHKTIISMFLVFLRSFSSIWHLK